MSDFLDNYGVKDAKREKLVKIVVGTVLALLIIAGAGWFFFRNYKEEGRVREFLALLNDKDYKSAYVFWGCTEAKPCRDYTFESFLRDWGPQSDAANVSAIQRLQAKSCDTGIIQILQVKSQDVNLFIDRATLTMGYSPWPG